MAAGLTAWADGNLDALAELLDPDVELLAAEPGPPDCHGRDAVMALLRHRQAEGQQRSEVQIEDVDPHTIVISQAGSAGVSGSATVATIRGDKVTMMRQYPTRQAALAAAR